MMDLMQVREELLATRIAVVASETGLEYTTVCEIRNGTQKNPRYNTLKALSDYFEGKANG